MRESRIVLRTASVGDAELMLAVMEPDKTRNLSFYLLDGIYHDMVLFSMLQREWERAR